MELSDLLTDLEGSKLIGIGCMGGFIGMVGGMLNFDDMVLEGNKKLIFKNPRADLEFAKGVIGLATAVKNVNYNGPLAGDATELAIYGLYARIGYEIGNKFVKSVKNYIKK